jgi:formylglycine-generating enzyme required for sulfatase activity
MTMASTPQFDELNLEIRKALAGYQARLSLPGFKSEWSACDASLWNWATGKPEWIYSADRQADGKRIYQWLVQDEKMASAWVKASTLAPQRRICLDLDESAPELSQVPWELLFIPGSGGGWAAGASATPFSRLLVGDFDPAGAIQERPIRILVVISNPASLPAGLPPIQEQDFWERLKSATQALVDVEQVELQRLPAPVSLESLEAELQKGYHILHFVGHGQYLASKGGAIVYLHHEHSGKDYVYAGDFAAMIGRGIQDIKSLGKPFLRLVTLASCQSAFTGLLDTFSSLAKQLSQNGLPAILAMQDLVGMEAALEFTTRFYQRLLEHGMVDLAANEARQALLTGKSGDAHVPVIFSRLKQNRLIEPLSFTLPKERQPFEPEMVRIPGGRFWMGREPAPGVPLYETPRTDLDLPAFYISKFPISNREYVEYVRQTHITVPADLGWEGRNPSKDQLNLPLRGVTWQEALDYCAWLSQQTGKRYTLPNEAQWEKAARGEDGRLYPWGETWEEGRCNQGSTRIVNVGFFPVQSVFGLHDLVGNVLQWTTTLWGEKRLQPDYLYPWQADDGREDLEANNQVRRVLRGSAYSDPQAICTCTNRRSYLPTDRGLPGKRHGFRVVIEP